MRIYNTYSDQELIERLRLGDDAAFKEIFQRYDKLLFLYACRKLRNEEEAKDVVQEVFVQLYHNRFTFTLRTSLSAYLYKAVLNRIFDIFKHQDIIRRYVEEGNYFIEVDCTETDYLIREKEIAALIEQEIAAMPPRMREIYELKRKDWLTTKQIAEKLEISELTVSTQLKRALKHLRMKLGLLVFILYILNQ